MPTAQAPALALVPVWARVSAKNARSLWAFQAAGCLPVGSEALLTDR